MRSEQRATTRRAVAVGVQAITTFIVFIAIGGVAVLELWNWLLPPLFGLPQISFLQALGILALSRILFGGSGLSTIQRSSRRGPVAERWEALTADEREFLRQRTRGLEATDVGSTGE